MCVADMSLTTSLSYSSSSSYTSPKASKKVFKKHDASTLQRLRAHMAQHNVDFIGGDFDMSGFSTVGDCLQLQSFRLLATRSCGVFGAVEGLNPAPHIHEQMTTSNYGYDIAYNFTHNNIMLEPNAMNNMNTVAHMDVHNTQY